MLFCTGTGQICFDHFPLEISVCLTDISRNQELKKLVLVAQPRIYSRTDDIKQYCGKIYTADWVDKSINWFNFIRALGSFCINHITFFIAASTAEVTGCYL